LIVPERIASGDDEIVSLVHIDYCMMDDFVYGEPQLLTN